MQFGAGPETGECTVPPPQVPEGKMDPTLGTATGVLTASQSEADASWQDSILASRLEIPEDHPLAPLRDMADTEVMSLPLPSRRQESWRFTNLRTVYASRYLPSSVLDTSQLADFNLRKHAPDTAGIVLVFVNGVYDEKMSLVNDDSGKEWLEAGGYFGPIAQYKGDLNRVRELFQRRELGPIDGGLFPTIGNAIASDALILDIPESFAVPRPVAAIFLSTGGDSVERASASATRLAVISAPGSRITLMESHVSLDDDSFSMTLASSAFAVARNANVSHYMVNACAPEAHILSNVHSRVEEGGNYEGRPIGVGARVGRFTIGVDLEGSKSNGLVHGSLLTAGYQVSDLHSRICHNASNTTSNQLQKNISSDHGRAIFNGKIIVTEKGTGTDSEQLCRSLLLSDKASVDAMPVLEIATDDVKCTHGATVSDLEVDELFYCQCRGLSRTQAQLLLVGGFASEILRDCPFPTISDYLTRKVQDISQLVLQQENLLLDTLQ